MIFLNPSNSSSSLVSAERVLSQCGNWKLGTKGDWWEINSIDEMILVGHKDLHVESCSM